MSPTTENVLRTACAMLDRGKSTEAAVLLQELIASHPACASALQMLGLIRAMEGDMRTAVRLLRQACVVEPENGSLRRHLARVEWEIGMPAQAAASYEQAIACSQASPDMRVDYAVALQAMKQYPAAIAQCEQAIATDPFHSRAWSTMGKLHHTKNHLTEALACHERATSLAPNARAWSAMGVTLHAMGRLAPALACHDKALACDAADAIVWTHRGVTLGKLEQHHQALDCQIEATRLDPALACAWSNMGSMLALLQRVDEALAAHDKAVSLQPSSAALWLQRGIALMKLKRGAESMASLNTAIRLDPASSAAWCSRAELLRNERRLPEALESLEEAVSLDPANELAAMLRIEVLHLLQRYEEALALLEQAVLAEPGNHRLRLAAGLAQLASGNFTDGWNNVQSYRHLEQSPAPRHTALPTWTGAEAIRGKRVLVYAEEGHGDVIQFCRYIKPLSAMGCEVVFEVYPNLRRLMSTLGDCEVVVRGQPLPPCDFCIGIMELPKALGAQFQRIPCPQRYLGGKTAQRPSRHGAGSRLRVGFACSGNPFLPSDPERSAPLALFASLQEHCSLLLLQNVVSAVDQAFLEANPEIQHPTAGFLEFADTAEIIETLDLVISVDTSIAHLAGALGKPVWILLAHQPDWRWFRHRDDSPWYDGARLFRQGQERGWADVIARVESELQKLATRAGDQCRGAA
ncbi:MAG: tetratricopeptide repeat protein [Proteobacteria bacterium]|nr:MAG: tetratricopeptide repeat protein [Pseudomonadota bacterium]